MPTPFSSSPLGFIPSPLLLAAVWLITTAHSAVAEETETIAGTVEWVVSKGAHVQCLVDNRTHIVRLGGKFPEGDVKVLGVTFPYIKITDDDLGRLKPLVDLERVVCLGAKIGDAGLAHLVGFERLRLVTVADSLVTDAGLEHLKKLKRLDTVGLSGTKITDAGMKSLAACKSLTTINLSNTAIGDAGVENLGPLPYLRDIRLTGTGVTDACLASLRRCEALMLIDLQGCAITDAALPELAKLPNLRSVGLNGTKVTPAGLAKLQETSKRVRIERIGPPMPAGVGGRPVVVRPVPPTVSAPPERITVSASGFVRKRPIAEVFEAPLPKFIEGSGVFDASIAAGVDPRDGVVEITIGQATSLYVAVSFYDDGRKPPGEKPQSYDRLLRDGWLDVCDLYALHGIDLRRKLLWKRFAAGEKLRLRTSAYIAPLVILPVDANSTPADFGPNFTMTAGQARLATKSKYAQWLRTKRFDELEKEVARLRSEKRYDADGESALKTFYDALELDGELDEEWADDLKLFEAWLAAEPKSIAAHYALAQYWTSFAWWERGKYRKAGEMISSQGYRDFNARILTARQWLSKASKLPERDPHFFFFAAESVVLRQETPEALEEALANSLKHDPDYLTPLAEATRFYLPRWFGKDGDMEKHAAKWATLTKERHGDSVYALVAMRGADYDTSSILKRHGFDWARVKRGFADLRRRFPKSIEFDEWNARFASFMEDRAEAEAAFARIDAYPKHTFTYDREMAIWRRWASPDFLSGDQLAVYETLKHPTVRLEWTVDDKHWIAFDDQGELAVFDAADGKLKSRVAGDSSSILLHAAVVPFGKTVVAASLDGKVRVYKVPGGEVRDLGTHEGGARVAALSSDGGEYATLGADGKIRFWDLDAKVETAPYEWDLAPLRVSALAYIPNSRSLAVGDSDHRVGFWNRDTLKKSIDLAPRGARIRSLRVSADGTMLAVLAGQELTLWRMKEWELTVTIPIDEYFLSDDLAFSRDGKSLAGSATIRKAIDLKNPLGSPTSARVILVWNTADGKLRHTLVGHKSHVRSMSFNSDGTRLVTGSDDMTIRVWKVD